MHQAAPPQQEFLSLPSGRSLEPPPPATASLTLCPFSSFLPLSLTPWSLCISRTPSPPEQDAAPAARSIDAAPRWPARHQIERLAVGIGRRGRGEPVLVCVFWRAFFQFRKDRGLNTVNYKDLFVKCLNKTFSHLRKDCGLNTTKQRGFLPKRRRCTTRSSNCFISRERYSNSSFYINFYS